MLHAGHQDQSHHRAYHREGSGARRSSGFGCLCGGFRSSDGGGCSFGFRRPGHGIGFRIGSGSVRRSAWWCGPQGPQTLDIIFVGRDSAK